MLPLCLPLGTDYIAKFAGISIHPNAGIPAVGRESLLLRNAYVYMPKVGI